MKLLRHPRFQLFIYRSMFLFLQIWFSNTIDMGALRLVHSVHSTQTIAKIPRFADSKKKKKKMEKKKWKPFHTKISRCFYFSIISIYNLCKLRFEFGLQILIKFVSNAFVIHCRVAVSACLVSYYIWFILIFTICFDVFDAYFAIQWLLVISIRWSDTNSLWAKNLLLSPSLVSHATCW